MKTWIRRKSKHRNNKNTSKKKREQKEKEVSCLIPILTNKKSFAAFCSETNEQFEAHLIPPHYNI